MYCNKIAYKAGIVSVKRRKLLNFQNIIEEVKATVSYKYPGNFRYRRLVNGYRIFDLSRGMDYTLDIGFRDLHSGKEVIKR